MAWYSDEQYTMIQDSREKKSIAASAFKQRTHCGKCGGVRLPSDSMSKKELKAMNGECIEYASLKKPMCWEDFKRLPNDLKKEYIVSLREKFNVPNQQIADMFNIHRTALTPYLRELGVANSKGGNRTWNKDGWLVWVHDGDPSAISPSETPVETVEEPVEEYDLRKPMSWEVFKSMPKELKIEYITWIRDYFGAPDKYIGEMLFKVSNKTMCIYMADLGVGAGKNAGFCKSSWFKESFEAWCNQSDHEEYKVEEPAEETVIEPEVSPAEKALRKAAERIEAAEKDLNALEEYTCKLAEDCEKKRIHDAGPIAFTGNQIPVIPKSGTMSFENNRAEDILTTLKTLLGDIRVTMTVSWECVPDNGICEH